MVLTIERWPTVGRCMVKATRRIVFSVTDHRLCVSMFWPLARVRKRTGPQAISFLNQLSYTFSFFEECLFCRNKGLVYRIRKRTWFTDLTLDSVTNRTAFYSFSMMPSSEWIKNKTNVGSKTQIFTIFSSLIWPDYNYWAYYITNEREKKINTQKVFCFAVVHLSVSLTI